MTDHPVPADLIKAIQAIDQAYYGLNELEVGPEIIEDYEAALSKLDQGLAVVKSYLLDEEELDDGPIELKPPGKADYDGF